jgi:4-amino-4-deoxy-L-arabinose transferase-like glycosyltransferase
MFRSEVYKSKNFYLSSLLGLFILNFILKLYHLGAEPFWYDEIISIKSALLDFGHIKHQADWDKNPPFYYYCLWIWLKITGISEFKARLLSVLFSSVSASLVFVLAKKYFNYITAISAALIFTFHNFSYEYSHEARCYSLVLMLVLISTIIYFKLIESPSYLNIFFLGLVNFLIIYSHYIAGLILLFQLTLVLFSGKRVIRNFALTSCITLFLVIIRFTKKQFLLILAYEKGTSSEDFWLRTVNSGSIKPAIFDLFANGILGYLLLLLYILAFVFFSLKRKQYDPRQTSFIIYSFVISGGSFILLFLIGIYKPLFLERYLLFIVPFICIVIAYVCNALKYSAFIIPVITFFQIYGINLDPQKPMDYRLAAQIVKDLRATTDGLILIQTKDVTGLFTYYYNKEWFLDQKSMKDKLKSNRVLELGDHKELLSLNPFAANTIIFCQTYHKQDDNYQIFDIFKQNKYAYITSKAVKGVQITLLKKN